MQNLTVLIHRAVRRGFAWSGDRLLGGITIGWGAFNLIEGIIDHHVLEVPHVREAAYRSPLTRTLRS